MGRWACSRNASRRERESGWIIGMLGRRQATFRWANDLVSLSEIMVQRQGTPRWEDEPVWWLWRISGYMEGLGSIHKNKKQILGFKQSLNEARKKHLVI